MQNHNEYKAVKKLVFLTVKQVPNVKVHRTWIQ